MFNYTDKEGQPMPGKIIGHIVLALVIIIFALSSFTTVKAGERGIVLNWGAVSGQVYEPGLHFKVPFMQRIRKMNVQTQAMEIQKSEAYSHDLQVVDIHSVINYNIDSSSVGTVYQQYPDFEVNILAPNLEASIKQTIAKYTAEELLSKRAEVQSEIETALKTSVPPQFIVTKYALVNEAFSPEFEAAIESKQVAQQKAEQAKNELAKAQIDADSRIAQAKGEAEAIQIQAQAIEQQGGANYVQLQAISKWDGHLPNQMIPGSTVPFVNLTK